MRESMIRIMIRTGQWNRMTIFLLASINQRCFFVAKKQEVHHQIRTFTCLYQGSTEVNFYSDTMSSSGDADAIKIPVSIGRRCHFPVDGQNIWVSAKDIRLSFSASTTSFMNLICMMSSWQFKLAELLCCGFRNYSIRKPGIGYDHIGAARELVGGCCQVTCTGSSKKVVTNSL